MRSRSTFLHRHPLGRWAAQPRSRERGCKCKCKCTSQRNPLRVSKSWIGESAVSVCRRGRRLLENKATYPALIYLVLNLASVLFSKAGPR
jgi:hypothetical protein